MKKKQEERFLEFNGTRISVLSADGTWWVAIRPICEALGVNYNRAYQNLQEDDILGLVFAKQQTPDKRNHLQEMICLPEKYIYGWLFSIRSDSEELKQYKHKCYVLYIQEFLKVFLYHLNTFYKNKYLYLFGIKT